MRSSRLRLPASTQKRYTVGFDDIQRIRLRRVDPEDDKGTPVLTARVAFYKSGLRGQDVDATSAKQEGTGTVGRVDVVTPIWDRFGQVTFSVPCKCGRSTRLQLHDRLLSGHYKIKVSVKDYVDDADSRPSLIPD